MGKHNLINIIKKLDNKLTPIGITPFPNKRSRNKTLTHLANLYRDPICSITPTIAWIAVLLNAFYTQERLVLAVTRKSMVTLCKDLVPPFKEAQWKDFIRICIHAKVFECIKGSYPGQPWIFVLIEPDVLEGFKVRTPDIDLEKMQRDQLEEVKLFVGKAKEIKKSGLSRNRS